MNREILQEYLAASEDHIEGAKRHVARQTEIVSRMHAAGHDTTVAEDILQLFESSLSNFIRDRELILRFLESSD